MSENVKEYNIVPTREMLYALCANGTARSKDNPVERQLAKLTHLPMDSRGLTKIANLKACTSVRVIYLYDNKIRRIENLSFAQHCTHLYLQNNELTDLGDLHGLKKLQKIYLDGNLIAEVTGLEQLERLEELHCARQRLPLGGPGLTFDPASIQHIMGTLAVLNVAACGIRDEELETLAMLKFVEEIDLSSNDIERVEYVQLLVGECSNLRSLDLRGNKVTKRPKYRNDVIVHASDALKTLDDRPIQPNERAFVKGMKMAQIKRQQKHEAMEAAREDPSSGYSVRPGSARVHHLEMDPFQMSGQPLGGPSEAQGFQGYNTNIGRFGSLMERDENAAPPTMSQYNLQI